MAYGPVPSQIQRALAEFQSQAPIRVVSLARSLGLKVYRESLVEGVSGKLFRDNATAAGWSISVNRTEPSVRQRFTVAHEIGHYALHRDLLGDVITDDVFYRSSLSNKLEAQANAFAADTLMPYRLINRYTSQGYKTASDLARLFEVSELAMSIRLGLPT